MLFAHANGSVVNGFEVLLVQLILAHGTYLEQNAGPRVSTSLTLWVSSARHIIDYPQTYVRTELPVYMGLHADHIPSRSRS